MTFVGIAMSRPHRQNCTPLPPVDVGFRDAAETASRQVDLGHLRLAIYSIEPRETRQYPPIIGISGSAMILLFQENGTARIQQNSGSIELQAGQWCGFQTDHPPLISASGRSRQLAISLPLRMLSDPRMSLEAWYAAQSFRSGAAQIFYCAAVAAALTATRLDKTDSFRVGASLAQLLEIALRDRHADDPPGAIAMRRKQALHFIESNLANPALSVTMIADAMGCSTRMVHKLFEDDMLTIGRHILAMRLDRCHAELSNAVPAQIDDIAFKWGFVSPQHFRRSFKQRFGCSPRDCRKGAMRPEYPAAPGARACA